MSEGENNENITIKQYCRILRELGGLEGVLLKARQEEIERMQLEAENQRNRPFSVEEVSF